MSECQTCLKPLRRATSHHKCRHGVWCGIAGRPQLSYRSRTCVKCNEEIRFFEWWTKRAIPNDDWSAA